MAQVARRRVVAANFSRDLMRLSSRPGLVADAGERRPGIAFLTHPYQLLLATGRGGDVSRSEPETARWRACSPSVSADRDGWWRRI